MTEVVPKSECIHEEGCFTHTEGECPGGNACPRFAASPDEVNKMSRTHPFDGNLDDHFEGPIEVLEFVTVQDHIRKRTVKAVLASVSTDEAFGGQIKATFITLDKGRTFMSTLDVPAFDASAHRWFMDYIHDALTRDLPEVA